MHKNIVKLVFNILSMTLVMSSISVLKALRWVKVYMIRL